MTQQYLHETGLVGNSGTYAVAVVIQSTESAAALATQIQAVYDDGARAPDGQFNVIDINTGTAIIFLRATGADTEVIGKPLTRHEAIKQLALEFEPIESDPPAIHALHEALLAQQDDHPAINFSREGWNMFEVTPLGLSQIQREDEIDTFHDDNAAIAYVEQQANDGSLRHLEAIGIHHRDTQLIRSSATA